MYNFKPRFCFPEPYLISRGFFSLYLLDGSSSQCSLGRHCKKEKRREKEGNKKKKDDDFLPAKALFVL